MTTTHSRRSQTTPPSGKWSTVEPISESRCALRKTAQENGFTERLEYFFSSPGYQTYVRGHPDVPHCPDRPLGLFISVVLLKRRK